MAERAGLSICALMLAMITPAVAGAQDQSAQVAKGRQVVAEACTTCHTTLVRMIEVHKQTPEQWKDTVYFMISRGAQVMPDEIDAVAAFLAETSGRGGPGGPGARGGGAGGRAGAGGRGAGAAQETRGGDGGAILQRSCQQCHEAATALSKPDAEEWPAVITRMMTYGARLSADEQQTLVAYLSALKK